MTDVEIAETLERAADALFVYGREIGDMLNQKTGAMCVIGAIGHVLVGDALLWRKGGGVQVIMPYLRAIECSIGTTEVIRWSDETSDDAEVVDALRRCAKELRNNA